MTNVSKGISPLVILDKDIIDYARYIDEMLPVALKYRNEIFGDKWIFQQNGAKSHTHHLTQQQSRDNFSRFIHKDHSSPNSFNFNLLDHYIWDEFVEVID